MKMKGLYNVAEIIGETDYHTIAQIKRLCDFEILKDENLIIMPDNCPGIVAPIGTVISFHNSLMPSLVSSDIGCGVSTYEINKKLKDYQHLDKIVKEQIINHQKVDTILNKYQSMIDLNELYCKKQIHFDRVYQSMGTLGGGNHFLECEKDNQENFYITIHSGSRLLGNQVFQYYIDKGYEELKDKIIDRNWVYLKENLLKEYLHDTKIVQDFAKKNRECMMEILLKALKVKVIKKIDTVHNYVDIENNIIRKGAISAQKDELLVIPINAKDGVILGKGLGNSEWMNSAPHGAGRLFSRGESKQQFTLHDFKEQMQGIYSSCINEANISECPNVYRTKDNIINSIEKKTIDTIEILKPVYSFKQS